MAGDWVRLHRKVIDSQVFSDHNAMIVWVWCLCRASYKVRYWQGQKLEPGEFVTGRMSGASECQMSDSTFYRALKKLESWGNITLKVNSKWTTVSICQWRTYQHDSGEGWTADEQQMDSTWTADEQHVDTNKKDKKDKKGRKKECNTDELSPVDLVVTHYQTHHPRSKPGAKERKRIADRLAEGYSVDDLVAAIEGNHKSPFHCGVNKENKKWHGLEVIFRDSSQVQSFIEMASGDAIRRGPRIPTLEEVNEAYGVGQVD